MVKHRKSNTPDVHVSAGGSSVHSKKPRSSKATWILIAAFVVVFGGLGTYFLTASHADVPTNNYTLYHLSDGANQLYTTSATERPAGFKLIGSGTPFTTQDSSSSTNPRVTEVPVYGAVKGLSHFLTESLNEYSALDSSYKHEGIRFYAASSPSVPAGYCRQTWYRLVSSTGHFYTPDPNEVTVLLGQGYTLEKSDAFDLDYVCPSKTVVSSPTPKPIVKPAPAPVTKPTPPATTPPAQKVSCSPVAGTPTEQVCNGTCPTGTAGNRDSRGYYYCFKQSSPSGSNQSIVPPPYVGLNDGCGGNAGHYYISATVHEHVSKTYTANSNNKCVCGIGGNVIPYDKSRTDTESNPGCPTQQPPVTCATADRIPISSKNGYVCQGKVVCTTPGDVSKQFNITDTRVGYICYKPPVPDSTCAAAKRTPIPRGYICQTNGNVVCPITGDIAHSITDRTDGSKSYECIKNPNTSSQAPPNASSSNIRNQKTPQV